MTQDKHTGKVVLAGAGPGDPELITVKAMRFLEKADTVIVDRLVSHEILARYVNTFAEIIYAGKQAGKGYSTRQTTINRLLVEHASMGKLVVRLKGGDVSVFSNILDELKTLVENNIPYEIIPGITAAAGAAACAGIPLTARDHAVAVRFLTYYKSDTVPDAYWEELAKTDDTLVFYMSAETLPKLVEKLEAHNVSREKGIAVIEQATTPLQKVRILRFGELNAMQENSFLSPTLVIVGKTVFLHDRFRWMEHYEGSAHYFQPLTKAMTTSPGQKPVYS